MDVKKIIRIARKSPTPGTFISKLAKWFFGFDWIAVETGLRLKQESTKVIIGIDWANAVNYLISYIPALTGGNQPFAGQIIDSSGTPQVRVAAGEVCTPNVNQAVATDDFDLDTDADIVVTFTLTLAASGSPYSVTSTLTAETGAWDKWSATSTVITVKWLIGVIDTDTWAQHWTGDIHLPMPGFKDSIIWDAKELRLDGDEETPSDLKLYGVDKDGNKGWQITGGDEAKIQSIFNDDGALTWEDIDPDTDITTIGSAAEGSEAAETTTWTAGTTNGLAIWQQTRTAYYHAGDKKLYGYARKFTYSRAGVLYSVSAETRFTIDDATDDC